MVKEKVTFEDLKVGAKFRFNRKLFIKDDLLSFVQLSNGEVSNHLHDIQPETFVTPVRVEIRVKG